MPTVGSHIRTLIWLRWAITRRSLSRLGWAMRIFSLVVTIGLALYLFFVFRQILLETRDLGSALRLLLAFVAAMGIVFPMLSFHQGASTDPSALFRYPIRPVAVFLGTVMSRVLSLASIYPVAIALAVAFALAPDGSPSAFARVLVIYLGFHAWLIITTQVGLLAFHTFLASRRTRDFLNVVSALTGVGIYLGITSLRREALTEDLVAVAADVPEAVWLLLPSTWAADLMVAAPGHGVRSVVEGAGLAIVIASGLLLGGRASVRAFFAEVGSPRPSARASGAGEPFLGMRWLPVPDRVRVVVIRELCHVWRDPVMKGVFIRQLGFILLPIILPMVAGGALPPGGAMVHLIGVLLLVGESELLLNVFAVEGRGLRQTLSHPIRSVDLLIGKNLAYALCFLPFNFAAMLAADMIAGFAISPAVVAVEAASILLMATGLGNVSSLYFPIPMPQSTQRALQAQSREGRGGRVLGRVAFVLALGISVLPIVIVAVFLPRFPIGVQLAGLIGMVVYAAIGYVVSVVVVGGRLEARLERLLKAID